MQQNDADDVVFVTGATGRLGRAAVKTLTQDGCTVRALMIAKEEVRHLPPGTVPFSGTLLNKQVLDDACRGAGVVFHFAAIVGVANATAEEAMTTNVEGTKNLLDACKRNNVKHLIFSSSIDVYGSKRKGSLSEETRPMPTDKYGYSKMLAEQEIMKSGVPYTILRIGTIYGHGFEHSFFKVFRAIREGKMVIVGRGNNHMSLISLQDLIKAIMLVKENRQTATDRVYNVSDGVAYTQEGLIDTAADLLKVERPKRHVSELLVKMLAKSRGLDSDELRFLTSERVLDISRIKKDLGFAPDIDIKTGMGELVNEFLNRAKTK